MKDKILLGHGSGGKLMNDLIRNVIRGTLHSGSLQLDDSAVLTLGDQKLAFTTDTFTITPIFFPGGDIGKLAVNGTVNDLAVMGAKPLYISCALILEEGGAIDDLKRVLESMHDASVEAGVQVVTGDTKVVEKGKGDRIFINTSGIGILTHPLPRRQIEVGDQIIVNGSLGDHGIAVMAERNGLSFTEGLVSDCAPLNRLIEPLLVSFPRSIKFMRDATRGGAASVLNEIVQGQAYSVRLFEKQLPIRQEVQGVCEILGIDPLYAANEGKVIMVVKADDAGDVVAAMKELEFGREACIIGEITGEYKGTVFLQTEVGGRRILPLLIEEQLPRIC
jgi:hydrogenase expression/formation protein HypE